MFNKTQRKIVFAIVFSLMALLMVTLTSIYIFNYMSIQRENREMLQTYVERYALGNEPGPPKEEGKPEEKKELPKEKYDEKEKKAEPAFKLSTFYSVAYSETGDVLAIDNGDNGLESEEELLKIASSALKKGKNSGKIGNLTYLIDESDDYTLVAMIDGTINEKNQRKLLWQMAAIGGAALVVLFVISLFISRSIVRPIKENNKMQKRFISDAGHELKTPIAVISANSELLKREIGENEWLSNIDYENERMFGLVKQLLSLSHAENDTVQKESLDLSQLVIGEVLPFESLAFEKNRKIESDIETGLHIDGDANKLRQLVSILLDNALSHGIGDTIRISLKGEKQYIVLSVINGANEMKEEQVEHLFDRFYRTDESRSETDSHYGLGLSIAKAVTESHNGTIHAEYHDGEITFTVTLPKKN